MIKMCRNPLQIRNLLLIGRICNANETINM